MPMSNQSISARLEPRRHDLVFRSAILARRTHVTPSYVRLRLEGPELSGFDSPGADDHIRVFFPSRAADDLRSAPSREYTPVTWDATDGWLDIDVALHGAGVGSRWAETAAIGAPVGVGGPRGSMVLVGRPDAWLLAGDETAVPAIRRFAAQMDDDAVGRIASRCRMPRTISPSPHLRASRWCSCTGVGAPRAKNSSIGSTPSTSRSVPMGASSASSPPSSPWCGQGARCCGTGGRATPPPRW